MSIARLISILGAGAAALCLGTATAASDFPQRTIRLVVPYPAGGTSDQLARAVAMQLTKSMGQTVYVENKAGGTGTIGALDVARSAPDGYTLMLTDQTVAISPSIFKKPKFDPVKDFTPIGEVATTPVLLVANKDTPFHSVKELVDAAHKAPDTIDYGAGGYGGSLHLAFERFGQEVNARFSAIPYKGSGETMVGLLSGQVQIMISGVPSVAGQVRKGLVRGLAVTGEKRLAALPDVPTFAEAGVPGYQANSWLGIFGPANMDPAVVRRLNEALNAALRQPAMLQTMETMGSVSAGGTPEAFGAQVKKDVALWAQVARRANIKPQ
ncbi:Bug family tripartite tricarboxylate transporter substrate binding protein [Achromobacter aloeverae]